MVRLHAARAAAVAPSIAPIKTPLKTHRYLFLQGQISHFFAELGRALYRRGHAVHRIHFNSGDARFWTLPGAVSFRGGAADWPDFFTACLADWGITDVILFGDCRPRHAMAIPLARARGVRVHVFEEGYLRPDFVTLERDGVNGHSPLPREPAFYLQAARQLPELVPPQPVKASFLRRAIEDIAYNLISLLGRWRFAAAGTHRPWSPFTEYAVGARRFPLKRLTRRRTIETANAIASAGQPYFLFPLQLDADTQIRFHADVGGMAGAITRVMDSFAAQADATTRLVITEHPLDYGPVDMSRVVHAQAQRLGVGERVVFLRGGSPECLLRQARGVIVVNSTMGIAALAAGVPVLTLGRALYDLPGLTAQQGLDNFWAAPTPPDAGLFDAFRRVLTARTQINGGFHSREGITLAVQGAVARLEQAEWQPSALIAQAPLLSPPLPFDHTAVERPAFATEVAEAVTGL
jgi:capsular polysaccharide export protein